MTSRTTMWRRAAALAVAVLGGVHCPGAGAVAIELGVFAPYNLVVLGDATDLAYVEGRLAVGGTLDTLRLTVGPAVSSTESDVVAVVVKDVRRWSQGALLRGGTLAAQARINGARGPEVTIPGIVRDEFGPVIDMAASTVNAEILSEQIRAAARNGWPVVEFSRRTKSVIRRTTTAVGAAGVAASGFAAGWRLAKRSMA